MLLGADRIAMGGKLSAKSYVQDGLIAMWDGIENIGFGKHSNTTKVWKDLCGNYDATFSYADLATSSDEPNWMDNGYIATKNYFDTGSELGRLQTVTQEVICKKYSRTSASEYSSPFSNVQGGGCGLQCSGDYGTNGVCAVVGKASGGYYDFSLRSSYTINKKDSFAFSVDSQIKLYKNAVLAGTIGGVSTVRYNGYSYLIGREAGNLSGNNYIFDGEVFCVRVYNRALTAAEIAANYAIDKARFGLT